MGTSEKDVLNAAKHIGPKLKFSGSLNTENSGIDYAFYLAYTKVQVAVVVIPMSVSLWAWPNTLTLLHSERPKLYGVLAVLSAIGLKVYYKILFT